MMDFSEIDFLGVDLDEFEDALPPRPMVGSAMDREADTR